jgi:hypothetical protein
MKLLTLLLIGATCTLFTGCQDEPTSGDPYTQNVSTANSIDTESANLASDPDGTCDTDSTGDSTTIAAQSRHFTFTYAGALTDIKPGAKVSIWLPIATDTYEQTIFNKQIDVPGEYEINRELRFGNHVLYFQATADEFGEVPFKVSYELERQEHPPTRAEDFNESQTELFISASRFVPTSANLLDQLIDRKELDKNSLRRGRQLYNAINTHMKYDKPVGGQWGRGDSVWACDSQHGNCTDFHSLFISVCREQNIPARFEIGFPISSERGKGTVSGYHCWAKFVANKQWIPVDISAADRDPSKTDYYFGSLTENRVTFTIGRDLELVPKQQAGPVNFLVYPYAEVDGKPHSFFRKAFKYSDL